MTKQLWTYTVAIVFMGLAGNWQPAEAIPAFARKYETSCQTCHVAYPKLNAFGESFRLNGYQIPETDAQLKKDKDASLGSEGWKRVWPEGVWPGKIPGTPPLAVLGETEFEYDQDAPIDNRFKQPSVVLFLSGTLSEDISAYMGFHLFEEGEIGSLGRMFIQFSSLFANWKLPHYALNVRIGQFIPDAVAFANHRGLTLTPYAPNTYAPSLGSTLTAGHAHGGSSTFALESNQLSIETRGVLRSRFRYALGLSNGSGTATENNNAKDGYLRLAYKLGGIGFDGSGGGSGLTATSFIDNALVIGCFGYLGALDNTALIGPEDLRVKRAGIDANITYKNWNLFGLYTFGQDQTLMGNAVENLEFASWFAELNYSVYPWLIGVMRYEAADTEGFDRINRIVPNITMLPRPNIKAILETNVNPDDVSFEMLMARLDFAF